MKQILSVLFVFLFVFSLSFAQLQPVVDKDAVYTKNPNPTVYVPETPLEEVFGSNQNIFGPSGVRGRGNTFLCTTPKKLIEHRLYLNAGAGTNMWFVVYEGASFNGTYNLVNSVNMPNSGPGEGWYSSGPIDYDLQAGMYYMIYTLFDVNANYYNQQAIAPYPIDCSFGQLIAGVGWNWSPVYASPPNPTETPTEVLLSGVAYYQTIVTDDLVPVELTSFTANVVNDFIQLNWQTATEVNNQGFEIERRTEATEFRTIGFVEGNGTTTEQSSYSYLDKTFDQGINYYRLKQVDYDGSYSYSNEVEVDVTSSPTVFDLAQNFPNPFNPTANIKFSVPESGNVKLSVYNLVGEEVAVLVNGFSQVGTFEVKFDASNLSTGVYLYKLQSANYIQTKKMMLLK